MRRIVVQANTAGRDLASVVEDIQQQVSASILPGLPAEYFVEYGGQFEAQREAHLRSLLLGVLCVAGVFLLLYKGLESWQAAAQVMVNVPLAAMGSVVALLLASWPGFGAFAGTAWWD